MPEISVIVPVYNTAKYLPNCLDSLVKQTFTDLEIICVNDASTDNSLSVIKTYMKQDGRIKLIHFNTHQGVSVARNEAIKSAKGKYIGFADSDDFVDLDFYEKLYQKAQETDADVVKGDLKELCLDGQVKTYPQNDDILKYKNKLCFYIGFTSAIYRTSLIKEKHLFFDSRLIHTEDLVWLNRVMTTADSLEVVENVFYHYQHRENSADGQIFSHENVQSAYVGYKHIFLRMYAVAQKSSLDFSSCYQNYFGSILTFLFRTPNLKDKELFCKLLFFFYQCCPDFYARYLANQHPAIGFYLAQNNLEKFVQFMKDKNSFMSLKIADFRYHVCQNQGVSKISVIVPVYNSYDFLTPCLDSIFRQTYQNLEIICVDDCSTDDSLKLLESFAQKDSRIRIIKRTENGGQAAARQSGIDAATGSYIGFVDSDDWLDEDYYEKMVEKARQDQTDIVINATILDHVEDKVTPHVFHGHTTLERKIYDNPSQFIDKFFCVVWNKLFKTSFLKQRKYIIPVRSAHEDDFFHYATFAFAKSVSFFDGPAYHYLYRGQSISNAKHDWGVEHIKVFSQIFDLYYIIRFTCHNG